MGIGIYLAALKNTCAWSRFLTNPMEEGEDDMSCSIRLIALPERLHGVAGSKVMQIMLSYRNRLTSIVKGIKQDTLDSRRQVPVRTLNQWMPRDRNQV
jgi:hypothetical protein